MVGCRQPIPVNLKRKDLKAELGRAISATYFHPSTGTSQYVPPPSALCMISADDWCIALAAL